MSIEVEHVSKTFGQYKALDDVSVKIKDGDFVLIDLWAKCNRPRNFRTAMAFPTFRVLV